MKEWRPTERAPDPSIRPPGYSGRVSSSVLEATEEDKFEIIDDENGYEEGDIPF